MLVGDSFQLFPDMQDFSPLVSAFRVLDGFEKQSEWNTQKSCEQSNVPQRLDSDSLQTQSEMQLRCGNPFLFSRLFLTFKEIS